MIRKEFPEADDYALQAVADLIAKVDPGAMAQRFVLLVEIFDADGDRTVWTFTDPGAKAWDTLGLLQMGIQEEAVESFKQSLGNED